MIFDRQKGELQGSYGGNTPSLLNNSPFFENSISQDSENSQEENLDTIRKQRKYSHNLAPGRSDAVADLAEFYRQEGILQEARGLGGVDAAANYQAAEGSVELEGGVKYSIKNTSKLSLKEQLNLLAKNKLKTSDSLYFGVTPKLSGSGLNEYPLAFKLTDYKKREKKSTMFLAE